MIFVPIILPIRRMQPGLWTSDPPIEAGMPACTDKNRKKLLYSAQKTLISSTLQ